MDLGRTLLLAIAASMAVACAPEADDEAEASSDALVTAGLTKATVRQVDVAAEDHWCTTTGSYAQVDLADSTVAAAINPTLVRSLPQFITFQACERDRLRITLRMVPTYNKGILSLLETQISPDTSAIAAGHNFDLKTGKALALEDVLTPVGIANLKAECVRQIAAGSLERANREKPELVCENGMKANNAGDFVIRNDGIHLQMNLWALADRGPGRNGVSVSWSKLGGAKALEHPALVAAYR